ncbi:transporter [Caenispirillum salinarum]|uniref:transporter n=1 Tax=Caenispirillum salinarum TaxID=859058 RepID=UPI00384DC63B
MTAFRPLQTGSLITLSLALAACSGTPTPTAAGGGAGTATGTSTEAVYARLAAQEARLAAQAAELERQRRELEAQRQALSDLVLAAQTGRGLTVPPRAAERPPRTPSPQVAQAPAQQAQAQAPQAPPPNAAADEGSTAPGDGPQSTVREVDLAVIRDQGGVLTPQGTVIVEPEVEFSTSSSNRFFFEGVEIVEAVLFGVIEATETERERATAAVGARYGVTDRLEVDLRVPYTYSNDRTITTAVNALPGEGGVRDLEGYGIGDVEAGVHYQLNDGTEDWPIFIGNLRVKTPTGRGPFDVDRDAETGLETELPTGSGFWTVEPSITALVPADPVVIFGNLGYAYTPSRDVDLLIPNPGAVDTPTRIGTVDPGDSIGLSFGVGIGFNERFSISLGYEHDYIFGTETEVNGVTTKGDDAHSASMLLGGNYRFNDRASVDLRIAAGLTEEAPDTRVTLRVPYRFPVD